MRIHVVDRDGKPVQGALVYVVGVPYNRVAAMPEVPTGFDRLGRRHPGPAAGAPAHRIPRALRARPSVRPGPARRNLDTTARAGHDRCSERHLTRHRRPRSSGWRFLVRRGAAALGRGAGRRRRRPASRSRERRLLLLHLAVRGSRIPLHRGPAGWPLSTLGPLPAPLSGSDARSPRSRPGRHLRRLVREPWQVTRRGREDADVPLRRGCVRRRPKRAS